MAVFLLLTTLTLLLIIFYVIFLITQKPGIIDVYWCVGILCIACFAFVHSPSKSLASLVAFGCIVLWACRLGGFILFTRIFTGHTDERYRGLLQRLKLSFNGTMLVQFLFQTVLFILISMPFYFLLYHPTQTIHILFMVGLLLFFLGIIVEIIADQQLYRFRLQASPTSSVCNAGLWRYSRHPNLLGELILWLGIFIMSLHQPLALLGVLSPIVLSWVIIFVTLPVTEARSLEHRGKAYRHYMANTPILFPFKRS